MYAVVETKLRKSMIQNLGVRLKVKKKNRLMVISGIFIILMLAVLPFIGGCATAGSLPATVSIQTTPLASLYHVVGTGLAKVITDHTPIKAIATPMSGFEASLPLFNTGEIDFGICNGSNSQDAFYALRGFSGTKGFDIRIVQVGFPLLTCNIVREDSGITKISDLKGKRVCWGYDAAPFLQQLNLSALTTAGLGEKDIILVPVATFVDAVRLVGDGKADCATVGVGAGVVSEVSSRTPLVWLSAEADQAAAKRIAEILPGCYPAVAKAGSHPIIKKDTTFLAEDTFFVARGTLNEAVTYIVAKALYDYRDELVPINPAFNQWTRDRMVIERIFVPYHAGAIKFYKEVGLWTNKIEGIQKGLLAKKK